MKKLLVAALIVAALAGCGKKEQAASEVKEVVKAVSTVELKRSTVDNVKEYNGEIQPVNQVTIITPTGGYVKEIFFKNGESVKAGDTILTLTDASTEASFFEAEGNLLKSRSDYNTTKISFDKYKKLYEKKFISEDVYLGYKNALQQAQGNLKVAEAAYVRAKDNYDRLTVKAKIPGVVTGLFLKEHEKVNGSQTLLTVVDNSKMELYVAVAGKDLKNIPVGTEADIIVEEIGQNLKGKIVSINLAADTNSKKYDVKIQIDNPNQTLLKGMYGKVNLVQGSIDGIFVPKEAVMIKDLYAYVALVRDGVSYIYKVNLGSSQGNLQEIYFDDHQAGDRVVVKGQYLLKNNDKVKEG
jgi:RND family efflux transporter MFP subunit